MYLISFFSNKTIENYRTFSYLFFFRAQQFVPASGGLAVYDTKEVIYKSNLEIYHYRYLCVDKRPLSRLSPIRADDIVQYAVPGY